MVRFLIVSTSEKTEVNKSCGTASLRTILPSIYDVMCKMMLVSLPILIFWTHDSSKLSSSLSNIHLYALLLNIRTTVSQMPTSLLSSNIHFEDVLGRVRSLPYESFRYWKVSVHENFHQQYP